ncbi:predicted protein [Nematostella vectensis]|uniref:5-formyltetrahydrofolate cyclo-ligase n=1 Tax=Nematostella vectensis TaxID=45351 RepID=A7SFC3_NEMVE|nr:5-formyltetrahydrofolate cyclo-ligase [Nematostella vectensis]EDO37618.1 predicted protein [Nematostella vectensis]|eukprot:XP_001629681.1 predicted protein [Nematostella vectensis]
MATSAAIYEAKKLLRRQIKKRILAMSEEAKRKESAMITEKLLAMEEYKSSHRISVYLSMPSEVSTFDILRDIFNSNKKCYIPRYIGHQMDMLRLHSLEDMQSLPLTPWNIHQPADDDIREEALNTGGLDVILVPGLGFSKNGQRLGRGKGYYDNYIQKCIELCHKKPHLIGLAFSTQMYDQVPVTENDMTLDHVVFCQSSGTNSK